MTEDRSYQKNFSTVHADAMYDVQRRQQKAKTMLAVLRDFLKGDLYPLSLLDIGASAGIIDSYLARHFGLVVGVDIDESAVSFAVKHHGNAKVRYALGDAMNLPFADDTFDALICAQVYEHVPDCTKLMSEIRRVLKKDGVCYFAAGNRINITEPHYRLPFLSVIPRPLAHIYLRLSGRGKFYYEKHLSYWGLRKLVREFEVIDYTRRIVEQPELFHVEYMIRPGSPKAKLASLVVRFAYALFPGYIWLLRKAS